MKHKDPFMISMFRRPHSGFNPLLTILVVGVWVVLMGMLVRDRYFPSVATIGEGFHIAATEADDWFLLRIGGAYAGFGRSRQFRGDGEWILRDDLTLALNLQGQVKPVKIANESRVDNEFRLISFHMKVSSGIISFEHKGRMQDRDLVLEIPRSQGGGTKRLKLHESPRMSRSLGLPVPLTGLHVGEEIRIPVFDPLDGNKWEAVIQVLEKAETEISGKKFPAWRVRAIFRTVELTMWIDDDGRLLKGRMPLNITVSRSDKAEISKEMNTRSELPDLVSMTSVPLEGSLPNPDDIDFIRLQVQAGRQFAIPTDEFRQKFAHSEITVSREKDPAATYALPCTDAKMGQDLVASRFIRSDHPDVIKKAREIIGEEKDPVKAAAL
ncbi:MAG TPA: hypothetical protein VK463_16455, partial [Desulfomonilaceae bacterium]|nr:hypothetical protein [Desulfomonilaceae bacterium]